MFAKTFIIIIVPLKKEGGERVSKAVQNLTFSFVCGTMVRVLEFLMLSYL